MSAAVAANVTLLREHWPASVLSSMSPGQAIVGFSVSLTITEKLQLAVLPDASVAVQVTELVPLANVEPLAGTHT